MTDKDIVDCVIEGGDNDAMLYLIYERYIADLEFYAWQYYKSLEYLDALVGYLFERLRGKDNDWAGLRSFKWKSQFRTWFCSVVSHLFLEKRKELLALGEGGGSIALTGNGSLPEPEPEPEDDLEAQMEAKREKLVRTLEAINRLENDVYRFILIKELEGYNHSEIANMLVEKRRQEKKKTYYRNKLVIPDAHYVDMNKARALKEVKIILKQMK